MPLRVAAASRRHTFRLIMDSSDTKNRKAKQDPKSGAAATVKAAFGSVNRLRLIDAYFGERDTFTLDSAWEHVYRLLLWVDQSNGLAHCYESDKCQPGKNWYGRSLAFHDWASAALKTHPSKLADEIDWLFRRATSDLAAEVVRRASAQRALAAKQRQPYEGRGLPQPGEDPELVSIVTEVLGGHFASQPSAAEWQTLVQRIRQYLKLENKRRNLLGEGFEDVLASVIRLTPGANSLEVRTRNLLHQLPGFHPPQAREKPNKVDLAVLRKQTGRRTLVTAKWSLRADREKQFSSEFAEYVRAEALRQPFDYVFITNEFDPARLMRACDQMASNAYMFAYVVHINTDAVKATYGSASEESMQRVLGFIESGRLIDLKKWLKLLVE